MDDVLRQGQIVNAQDAGQRGDHPPGLVPEEMLAGLHYMSMVRTGRTSIMPPESKIGQPRDISTACEMSFASTKV